MKILALGAHPDDIEIYMYGTLAAWKDMGAELVLVVATDGSKGGRLAPDELRRRRRIEAAEGAADLGVTPILLEFVDGELLPDPPLINRIKALMQETMPTLIVTHAPNDYHGDHRALSDAVRLASSFTAPVVWADNLQGVGMTPSYYVDITRHFDAKKAAIRRHASQDPERLVALVESLNGFRAAQASQPIGSYAEAFQFEPQFPFVDLRELFPPAPPLGIVKDRRTLPEGGNER
jgi:LmbE family N-acetylglucosaminyl deacetylase